MSSTLDLIKNVWDLIEKSKDAALKQAFVDLRLKVIDVQENADRRVEVTAPTRGSLFRVGRQVLLDRGAPAGPAQGPFCHKCHDDNKKGFPTARREVRFSMQGLRQLSFAPRSRRRNLGKDPRGGGFDPLGTNNEPDCKPLN